MRSTLRSHIAKGPFFFFFAVFGGLLFLFYSTVLLWSSLMVGEDSDTRYVLLAQAFIEGQTHFLPDTYFTQAEGLQDTIPWKGNLYFPLGPFPALCIAPLLMLFDAVGLAYPPFLLDFVLAIGVFALVYALMRVFSFARIDALYLALAYCCGSVFMSVSLIHKPYYFAHIVTSLLLFTAFYEFFTKRRFVLIGILLGCVAATRITAGVSILFFILYIMLAHGHALRERFRMLAHLLIPFGGALVLLALYNYTRFDSVFDVGYGTQTILSPGIEMARTYGVTGLIHIPGNLYHMLLASPDPVLRDGISHVLAFPYVVPNAWGMGIFVTSPYLLSLFFLRYRDRLFTYLWLTVLCTAVPILLFYGIGPVQIGYRYSLDFLPILFIIFARAYQGEHQRLSHRMKIGILFAVFINFWLIYSTTQLDIVWP